MVAVALHVWGAAEVRADPGEVFFLTLGGAIWLVFATWLFSWLGLSFRDDAVDRKNVAALTALCGAVLAISLIYAGGSLGEGPSYLENFFPAALGTGSLLILWIIFELGGRVSISIGEERDLASGMRMCGILVAVGLVIGRALAGDWHSETATIHDFIRAGRPAVAIWMMALIIEILFHPNKFRPFPAWGPYGLLPALFYLALAGAWIRHLGAWEGMP
jgi:uncharacterized membrane protein YjfL (UPF0719 family)